MFTMTFVCMLCICGVIASNTAEVFTRCSAHLLCMLIWVVVCGVFGIVLVTSGSMQVLSIVHAGVGTLFLCNQLRIFISLCVTKKLLVIPISTHKKGKKRHGHWSEKFSMSRDGVKTFFIIQILLL